MQNMEPDPNSPRGSLQAGLLALVLLIFSHAVAADDWFPIGVNLWTPPFNDDLVRESGEYTALEKAQKKWRICVSIPNLKDAAWKAISYGIISEVRRLDVSVQILDAGGYGNLGTQIEQVESCMKSNADGLILSSVSYEGLDETVERLVRDGVPVVDLINGTRTLEITARSAGSFWDNGYLTGEYLSRLAARSAAPMKVAWLPGPKEPAWAKLLDRGFREAIAEANIELVFERYGDLDSRVQLAFINELLDSGTEVDMIVASEAVINSAVKTLRRRGLSEDIKLVTFYYGPDVHNHIKRGNVLAGTSESMVAQARMSVDTMVRILEGKPYYRHHGAEVFVVDKSNIDVKDETLSLAPRGYRTIFSHDW